jgi:hypothetical protein
MSSWHRTGSPRREHDPADDDGHPRELHRGRVFVDQDDREEYGRDGLQRQDAELNAAGARGSAAAIRSQPSTCDVSASVSSHQNDSHDVRSSSSPSSHPTGKTTSAEASVAWKSAPAERRTSAEPALSVRRKPA